MMRLLFLCVLLLLQATTVHSEEFEGSADDSDDEDLVKTKRIPMVKGSHGENEDTAKTSSHMTVIIIVVAVAVTALSIIAVVAVMLMKRQKLKQQQGIYSVPIEQNHKEAI